MHSKQQSQRVFWSNLKYALDFRHIRDFLAVVHFESFAAASRELGISQPALSDHVKQLEEDLQIQLLERHARGVAPTNAGRIFMAHAEAIFRLVAEAKKAMHALSHNQRREIRIGISPTPSQTLSSSLLNSCEAHSLKVRLREGYSAELHKAVVAGELDLAICLLPGRAPLKNTPVYSESLYLIGPVTNPSTSQSDIPLADLGAFPLVLSPRGVVGRAILDEALSTKGVTPIIEQELQANALRKSVVLGSGCYTVAPRSMFAEEIEKGLVSARQIVDPSLVQSVTAVYSAEVSTAMEQTLNSLLRMVISAKK